VNHKCGFKFIKINCPLIAVVAQIKHAEHSAQFEPPRVNYYEVSLPQQSIHSNRGNSIKNCSRKVIYGI